ncbi:MAG: uroporphyrinogen decarboxylase family protein [Thermoleophilia bacterium]
MSADEQSWSQLSPDEKLELRWKAFVEAPIEFVSPEAEAAYRARATRLQKATLLQGTPDRVPVTPLTHYYPGRSQGLTPYEAMTDYQRAADAWLQSNLDLQPDAMMGPLFSAIPARAYEILDVKIMSWPGHGAPMGGGFQYNETEWMHADEYDLLMDDPTDFFLHVYMPRVAGGLEGLAGLVSPQDMIEIVTGPAYWMRWASPEVQETLEKLTAAGREAQAWGGAMFPMLGRLVAEGFPGPIGAMSKAPFDILSDTLRGTRGLIMDMFNQPDTVLEACDRLVSFAVKWVTRRATPQSPPCVFIPLHKGADGFMSDEQFKTFYWPSLRKVMLGLIEEGFVPCPFAEGGYNDRLEAIRDLPPGRTAWHFDRTDMRLAKEAMGGIACIEGNVPPSLLNLGTPEEVTAYCRDLIEAVAPGGGFILDGGSVIDEAKPENMRAMVQAAQEYGVY